MVPAFYQAMFPALTPFWQAMSPVDEPVAKLAPAAVSPKASLPTATVDAAPHDAAAAMMTFWKDASDSAAKFWSGPANPMTMAPRMAMHASEAVAEVMAPKPKPDASWYRQPSHTQDIASGAMGFYAGPFAALLPAFTATPVWSAFGPGAASNPMTAAMMSAPMMQSPMTHNALAQNPMFQNPMFENPWAKMWSGAMPSPAPSPSPMAFFGAAVAARPMTQVTMPAYQSDSGHAVAQIVHGNVKAAMALSPMMALMFGMMSTMLPQ